MATRHDIIHIDFEANAGKVSPALKAIQQASKDTATEIERVTKDLERLKKEGASVEEIAKTEKQLNQLNKDFRSFNQGAQELVKGVDRLSQGIKAFNDGTLSQMSAQFQKAVQNAAKLQKTKFAPDTAEGRKGIEEMNALIMATEKNILKTNQDLQQLVATISSGGHVSATELREAEQTLKGLKDLAAEGTTEWRGYNTMLTTVEDGLRKTADAEKRLRGEMVDANDARREALKLTEEGAAKAREQYAEAEKNIKAAKDEIDTLRQKREAKEAEVSATAESIRLQDEEIANRAKTIEGLEKEAKAEERKLKGRRKTAESLREQATQLAETATQQEQALEGERQKVQSLATEVQGLRDKLASLSAQPVKPKVDTSEIDELNAKLQEAQTLLDQKTEASKAAFTNYTKVKYPHLQRDRNEFVEEFKQRYGLNGYDSSHIGAVDKFSMPFDMKHHEVEDAATDRVGDWEIGKEQAQQILSDYEWFNDKIKQVAEKLFEQYQKLRTAASDGIDPEQLKAVANNIKKLEELKVRMVQVAENNKNESNYDLGLGGGDTFRKQFGDIDKELQNTERNIDRSMKKAKDEIYDFYEKKHEAEVKSAKDALDSADAERKAAETAVQTIKEQISQKEKLTQAQQQQTQASKEAEEVQSQLTQKEQELGKAQEELTQKETAATKAREDANKKADEATKKEGELAEKTTDVSKRLEEEKTKQQEATQAREASIAAMQKQQGEVDDLNQQIATQADKQTQAEQQKQEAQALTIKKMEEMVALLEKENREDIPANTEKWNENKAKIDELKQALAEAKGEVMGLDEALTLASTAGGKGFTGTAQQLQKAEQALQQALQKAEKGSTKWEEYRAALERVRTEMNNMGMTSERMHKIMDDPTAARNLNELRDAVKRAKAELALMEGTVDKNSKEYQELAESTKKAEFRLKELENQSKGTATAFDKAWSRLKTYVGLYMGAAVAIQKLTEALGDLMELSDKMGEVRKTTGYTADEVGRLSDSLAKLDTRTPIQELLGLSAAAGQLGLKAQDDVRGFTEAANKLIVALPEMGRESATSLMKIANATGDLKRNGGDVQETLERVGSTIISLRANSASAAPAITDFVSRVGAVGAQAGITIDQIAAMGSTIDALGGRVEMSATALSRMIPAIRNNSFAVANAIGVTESYLKNLSSMDQLVLVFRKMRESIKGIDTSTEEGMSQMADNVEALLNKNATMAEVMKELNQQGARAGIVFGLMSQNVDELERQLEIAGEAYRENTSLMKEYNNMNETAAAKWKRLTNEIEEMFVGSQAVQFLGNIIDGLRYIVNFISGNVNPVLKVLSETLKTIFVGWATFKIALGEGIFIKAIAGLKTLKDSIVQLGVYTKQYIALQWQLVFAHNAEEKAAIQAKMATIGLNNAMKANVFMAVAAAITYVVMRLVEYNKQVKEAAKQLKAVEEAEKKAREESVKERAELEKLYKATQDQTKSMDERKKALKDMVGDEKYKEYYENLSTESEFATAAASAYKELAEQIMATARARALDAKAEELQRKRIELEDSRKDREESRDEAQQRVTKNTVAVSLVGAQAQQQFSTPGMQQMAKGMSRESQDLVQAKADLARENKAIADIDEQIGQVDAELARIEEKVKQINPQGTTTDTDNGDNGGGGGNKPYGDYNKVTSPYGDWNASDLVARRKEMLERVKALAAGAAVRAVLSKDAKFITEATRQNIKTTKDAIEWYNTERLKIQDALHEKHLTNSGDWMDPKKGGRKASKMVQDEMKYYLDELDAYYTERKAKIQEERNDEQISEAEAWNRTIANEAEWRNRRAELQELYAKKSEKVTEEELDAILNILSDRTGDTIDFIKKDIEHTVKFIEKVGKEKGEPAMDRILGDLDLGIEKDFLRQRNAIGQHLKAIEDIINKDNPYNGIMKSLQDNLGKMDVLFADIEDKNQRTVDKEIERTMFIMEQATKGYSLTWEQLMEEMAKNGWKEWADAIQNDTALQTGLMHQITKVFESVQDAIKRESTELKRQAEIMWSNILLPGGDGKTTIKGAFEQTVSALGISEGRVSRANSLIGAGQASERVADKLAIQQMKVQLAMQQYQYNLMRKQGMDKIAMLRKEAQLQEEIGDMEKARALRMQADNVAQSLNLATRKEQTEELKLQEQIIAKTEESQNRLYTELRNWADLISSSVQKVFEAGNTGNAQYYNDLAKMRLTGEGAAGGTYVVINDAGTEDATAHYETLGGEAALRRQLEIEQQNATADAWKEVMDDINQKMNDMITDQINAMLQNSAVDANTDALGENTKAILELSGKMGSIAEKSSDGIKLDTSFGSSMTPDFSNWDKKKESEKSGSDKTPSVSFEGFYQEGSPAYMPSEWSPQLKDWNADATEDAAGDWRDEYLKKKEASEELTQSLKEQQEQILKSQKKSDKEMAKSTQSMYAKMTQAANLYGVAYQAMSNDNLDTAQKFEMIALQAAGNAAISGLQVALSEGIGKTSMNMAQGSAKAVADHGPILGPILFAVASALIGGLLGLATSKISKSKSEIAQVTGARSVASGRLATGMLAYAEGNVNEFTSPGSLTPGKSYNVDAADGKTYRAKFTGSNPRTHLTNGPEFHLAGEKGREMIIDAGTTRQITMDDNGIWRAIQTLSGGGRLRRSSTRRGRGVGAFAEGNVDDFADIEEMASGQESYGGIDMNTLQRSLDRNSAIMERLAEEGIEAFVSPYGKRGIVRGYDYYKKEARRHGQEYLE